MLKVLPLRVWWFSALLAAGVLGLVALYTMELSRDAGAAATAQAQRFLTAQRDPSRVRVLGLGSSLLWAATSPGSQVHVPGVAWERMTKSGSSLGPLQAVLDTLERHPPEVLVIETNLLLPASLDTAMENMRYAFTHLLVQPIAPLLVSAGFGNLPIKQISDQDSAFPCEVLPPAAIQKQLSTLVAQQNTVRNVDAVDTALRNSLLRLSQLGVHIVVLELRRSPQFEQAVAVEKQRFLQKWRAALPPGPRVSYMASPVFESAESYCDGRHMSDAGARRFAPWWSEQLQRMAMGR